MQLYLTNKNNQTLDLLNNRNRFILKSVEGLHGIETTISENESPYMDGTNIEYVKAMPRNIELTFKLRGNIRESIEYFTSYVKSKQYVTLREVENGRDISITGIATIPPYSRMMRSCEITLTIYCGQPYWVDTNYTVGVIDDVISLLAFPVDGQYFTIDGQALGEITNSLIKNFENNGDTSVGAVFVLEATEAVTNPQINCSTGEQQGWYIRLETTLDAGDQVVISTVKGDKYITINGTTTSDILSALKYYGTDWLQLEQGSNILSITADGSGAENVYFNATFKRKYE